MEPSMLERLRDYAEARADEKFPLGSCTECLAARMTGKEMYDYEKFLDGSPVPSKFAQLTKAAGEYRLEELKRGHRGHMVVAGSRIATAIDRMMGGRSPVDAARDMMDTQWHADDLNAVGSPT